MSPWPSNPLLRALAFLWVLPTNAVAFALALLFWPLGRWSPSLVGGVLEFVSKGPLGRWFLAANWAGVTIGTVRFLWVPRTDKNFARIQRHEARHSRQAVALGLLYGPIYGLLLLRFGYDDHPMEVDATAHEDP